MDRIDVRSPDGTPLAVWVAGDGPPIVLVHGSVVDHTFLAPLVDELRPRMTTFAMDRRGFGASGDAPPYSIERDFEDVAAVVAAAAEHAGGPVTLFGHSYGASCAMGAAALSDAVGHVVLYEPSLGLEYPPGVIDDIESAVAAGDLDRAAVAVLALIGLSGEEIAEMRAGDDWATRIADSWTLPREARAEEGWTYRPGQFDGVGPTLLLAGSESPPELARATDAAAAAIQGARIHVLEGHAHLAVNDDPALVADAIRSFAATGSVPRCTAWRTSSSTSPPRV